MANRKYLRLYAEWGYIFWLTLFGCLIVAAFFCPKVANFLTVFGTLLVALVAIWQDRMMDVFNPIGADLILCPKDPDLQTPFNDGKKYEQYHAIAKNLNPTRPLKNARVSFRTYSNKEGEIRNFAVPRQFTWAPHESEPRDASVRREKPLDLFYYCAETKKLFLIVYGRLPNGSVGMIAHPLDDSQKSWRFDLVFSADNLLWDVYKTLKIEVQNGQEPVRVTMD